MAGVPVIGDGVAWEFRYRVACSVCGVGTHRYVDDVPMHRICIITKPEPSEAQTPQGIDVASLARELAARIDTKGNSQCPT